MKKLLKKPGFASFLSALISVAFGMLIGFIVLLIAKPSLAVAGITTIVRGSFVSLREFGQMLYDATPIMMTGLSVGFANKCGLFNIGGPGQFIVGGLASVYVGIKWSFLPGGTHWVVALIMGMLAGAIWGLVPGIMKALFNVNEVIACIMMNYIGMSFTNLVVRRKLYDALKNQSLPVRSTAILPKLGMDQIFVSGGTASSANAGIIIAIGLAVAIYVILNRTKFGFEMKACGYNRDAARYAGVNEKRSIVFSMVIAGALAGLGGGLLYLAGAGRSITVVDVLANEGFNGIPVALLGMNNPLAIIVSSLFIANLTRGGFNAQSLGFAPQIVDIITGVIIYFSAFTLFFTGLIANGRRGRNKPTVRKEVLHTPPEKAAGVPAAKGGDEA